MNSICTRPEEKERIGIYIRKVSNQVKKTVDAMMVNKELTGIQAFVLGYLQEESQKKDIYQKDVEAFLKISKASVTSLLQQMEKKGIIRRESVEGDARLKRIVVTSKGEEIRRGILCNLDQIDVSMKRNISEQELRIFFRVMDQIHENLMDTYSEIIETKGGGE